MSVRNTEQSRFGRVGGPRSPQWASRDSNPGLSACKADALAAELLAPCVIVGGVQGEHSGAGSERL